MFSIVAPSTISPYEKHYLYTIPHCTPSLTSRYVYYRCEQTTRIIKYYADLYSKYNFFTMCCVINSANLSRDYLYWLTIDLFDQPSVTDNPYKPANPSICNSFRNKQQEIFPIPSYIQIYLSKHRKPIHIV